jgi:hypothetical protein
MVVDELCRKRKGGLSAAFSFRDKRQPLAVPTDMTSIGFHCFIFRFLPAILVSLYVFHACKSAVVNAKILRRRKEPVHINAMVATSQR